MKQKAIQTYLWICQVLTIKNDKESMLTRDMNTNILPVG